MRWSIDVEQFATQVDALLPDAVGEEAVVPDPHESRRHYVEKKTAQEIDDVELQQLGFVAVGPVSPLKRDASTFESDDAVVRQCDSMGIPHSNRFHQHLVITGSYVAVFCAFLPPKPPSRHAMLP